MKYITHHTMHQLVQYNYFISVHKATTISQKSRDLVYLRYCYMLLDILEIIESIISKYVTT